MNKIILLTLITFFSMFCSSFSYAEETNNTITPECQNIAMYFNNTNAADTFEEKVQADYNSVAKCVVSMMGKTYPEKIFVSFFGEVAYKSMASARSFLSPDIGYDVIYEDIKASDNVFVDTTEPGNEFRESNRLRELIHAFNYIINEFLLLFVGVLAVYHLINTAKDGEIFGSALSTFWQSSRFVFVLFLMAPLESLEYFSLMQAATFIIISLAVFSANFIWMTVSVADVKEGADQEAIVAEYKTDAYQSISRNLDDNIILHVCDIQDRKYTLLKNLDFSGMNSDAIVNSKFNECLVSEDLKLKDSVTTKVAADGEGTDFTPQRLHTTNFCKTSFIGNVNDESKCGLINFNTKNDSNVEKIIDVVKGDHQKDVRKIAEKVIHLACLAKDGEKFSNSSKYYRSCSKYEDDKFEFHADGSKIVKTYSEDEGGVSVSFDEIKNEIVALKNNIYQEIEDKSFVMLAEEDAVDKSRAFKASAKGFFGASSFIFENGKRYNDAKENYRKSFLSYKVANSSAPSGEDFLSISDYKYYVSELRLQAEEESNFLEEFFSGVFFGINIVRSFNQGVDGDNGKCEEDFSYCSIVKLNPINEIVQKGINVVDRTIGVTMLLYFLEYGTEKYLANVDIDNSKMRTSVQSHQAALILNGVASFFKTIMFLQATIGYFMIYVIPLIIFVNFIGIVISWVISCIQAILIVNLWLVMHVMPSREEGIAGHAKLGYNMLMEILVKPSFLVMGMFGAFIVISVLVAFLNVSFGIVLDSFAIFHAPNSPLQFFYNFIIDLLYFIFLVYVCFRGAKAIYKIPRSLISWIGFQDDANNQGFSKTFDSIKNQLVISIKKYIIIV